MRDVIWTRSGSKTDCRPLCLDLLPTDTCPFPSSSATLMMYMMMEVMEVMEVVEMMVMMVKMVMEVVEMMEMMGKMLGEGV